MIANIPSVNFTSLSKFSNLKKKQAKQRLRLCAQIGSLRVDFISSMESKAVTL